MGLAVSEARDCFLRDGEKFFYLADTCWSAFTNATLDEWEYYLEYRRMQGFNALQINVLPQHDRSEVGAFPQPFKQAPDGRWDFGRINEEYFDRVEKMVEMAVEKGFTPALVVLWCNYVPGTWGSRLPIARVIPREHLVPYVEYVAERFGKYEPVFVISGDTNFESPEAVEYYATALDVVKRKAPRSLTTMHLCGGLGELPESIWKSPNYDFYMYQSSHDRDNQRLAYQLAERFYRMPIKRPIVNGEPCYEGIAGGKFNRFSRADVRRAVWWSLLSGAKAGTAYGVLGIWNWHRVGAPFYGEPYGGPSFDWRTALRFEGAFDVTFAKWLFERYDLFDIEPANELLLLNEPDIRVAQGKGKIVVYTPYSWDVKLKVDTTAYKWECFALETRCILKPRVEDSGDGATLRAPELNSDVLIIGVRS